MKKKHRLLRQIKLIYVLTTIFLIALFVYIFIQIKSLIDSSDLINHTNQVNQTLQKISIFTLQSETNKRSYFLTGDSSSLQKRDMALDCLAVQVALVEVLINGNPTQVQSLKRLKKAISEKIIALKHLVTEKNKLNTDSLIKINTLEGAQKMEIVSQEIDYMMKVEAKLFKIRTQKYNWDLFLTPLFVIVLFMGAILILLFSYFRLYAELNVSWDLQKELAFQNTEKEKRAMELILANEELVFQNHEKEKLAAELVIANKEIAFQNNEKEVKNEAYKYALDQASIIAITDQKGIIKHVNENFCKVSKYPAEELIGQNHRIINSGYHSKEFFCDLWTTIASGKIWKGEIKNKAKDGSFYWVDTTIVPSLNEEGKPYQYLAIRKDITELKQSSEYARSLIEASLDSLVTISIYGKITDVNAASIKVTGFPREELIDTDFSTYFTEPEKARKGYIRVFEKGFVSDYPLTIKHKDGNLTDVLYNASVYKDDKGNVLGVFAAARDVTEQKQASQYARSLIEASLDPLVTISADGKITDVNAASIKVTGIPREKLIGTDFSNYFTEPKKAQEGYLQVFEKGFVSDYPLTIKHKDGNLTDVLYNASVYKDDKGNVLGVFAAARDVTSQKQIEDELLKTQKRLNVGLKIANIALSEISYITNTVQLSPESAAMYGFPKNQLEATRQQLHDTFHPDNKAELEAQIIIAMNPDSGGYMALEHPIVLPSGEVRWLKVNKQFFYDHSTQPAKPVYSILVSQDITERIESSQYARSLIEASLDPLVTISADGKITDVNAASIKVTGIPREKLIGTDFSNYFTEPKKSQEGYLQVFEKGFVSDYPLTIKHKDGNLTDVLYNASVYKDSKGKILGVFAAARDVNEQKWAKDLRVANIELAFQNDEKEKRAAELVLANKKLAFQYKEKERRTTELDMMNKELQLFTHISSHDLQEPLRKLQISASRIAEKDIDNLSDKGKEYFKRMQDAALSMETLINDLINYARANNKELIFENAHLNDIIQEAINGLKDRIDSKEAIIEVSGDCKVHVIPFQIRQLMHNLIGNALKFSKPDVLPYIFIKSIIKKGKELHIDKLLPQKLYCHISVSDNGIGFAPEYSEKIFEIFQRLHSKDEFKGTGIGLAIAKKIVENHQGIIIASSQIDEGATFNIFIPSTINLKSHE